MRSLRGVVARNDLAKVIYALLVVRVSFLSEMTEDHAQANHDEDGGPV